MAKMHFVSRYKYSHDKKRIKFKKWIKQGKVKLLYRRPDGWVYEELPEYPISVTHSRRCTTYTMTIQGK